MNAVDSRRREIEYRWRGILASVETSLLIILRVGEVTLDTTSLLVKVEQRVGEIARAGTFHSIEHSVDALVIARKYMRVNIAWLIAEVRTSHLKKLHTASSGIFAPEILFTLSVQ